MIGYKIGRNVEIAQTAILDPFCPPLIEIRSDTMIGSFAKIFSHGYKGRGEVMIGKVTIGENCRVLANSIMGPINIGNNVVVMVNTSLTPYFRRVKNGTVVGHDKPTVKNIDILS
jgi:acetyltransferase-like isoleucine patch superfamily enzyme